MLFAAASRRIGPFSLNQIRLVLAVVIYTVILAFRFGSLFPSGLHTEQVLWLGLSSLSGLVVGDWALFQAFDRIGPRLTMLLHASAPVWATLVAWAFLHERLGPLDLLGIAVTLGGTAWVVAERQYAGPRSNPVAIEKSRLRIGIAMGLLGALGQGVGLVMAKQGMVHVGHDIDPMTASYIRMLVGAGTVLLLALAGGRIANTLRAVRDLRALRYALGGSLTGPFLGVWMSLVAVRLIDTGVAATLNATTPIAIIPLVMIVYKERISLRALLGALLSVGGIAILMLS